MPKVGRGMTSSYATDTLAELFSMRGVPNATRSDNGPEIVAKTIPSWLAKMGVQTLCIEPGQPVAVKQLPPSKERRGRLIRDRAIQRRAFISGCETSS